MFGPLFASRTPDLVWSSSGWTFLSRLSHIKIHQPVFVISNPPQRYKFLQSLFARDRKDFLSMKTWEIYRDPLFQTAPSILDPDRIRDNYIYLCDRLPFLAQERGRRGMALNKVKRNRTFFYHRPDLSGQGYKEFVNSPEVY